MTTKRRVRVTFSASPKNTDALLVQEHLANLPARQRSAAIWAWASAYLRGETGAVQIIEEDEIDDEDFADLIGGL